jgi:hypothetical protein
MIEHFMQASRNHGKAHTWFAAANACVEPDARVALARAVTTCSAGFTQGSQAPRNIGKILEIHRRRSELLHDFAAQNRLPTY